MADAATMRARVARYIECFNAGDRDAWLDLFAPDASVEDPVGTEPHVGRDAIGAFYDMAHSLADALELQLLEPVKPCGDEIAFGMRIVTTLGGSRLFVDVIEIQTYDEAGRLTAMRAFWSMDEMAPYEA